MFPSLQHKELRRKIPDFVPMDPRDSLRPARPSEVNITEVADGNMVSKLVNIERAASCGSCAGSASCLFLFLSLPNSQRGCTANPVEPGRSLPSNLGHEVRA